jgi:hypothetical protein
VCGPLQLEATKILSINAQEEEVDDEHASHSILEEKQKVYGKQKQNVLQRKLNDLNLLQLSLYYNSGTDSISSHNIQYQSYPSLYNIPIIYLVLRCCCAGHITHAFLSRMAGDLSEPVVSCRVYFSR